MLQNEEKLTKYPGSTDAYEKKVTKVDRGMMIEVANKQKNQDAISRMKSKTQFSL